MNTPPNGFKPTEIGLIPEEWALEKIGNLAEIKYGKANPKSSGQFPVVGSGGIYAWTDTPLAGYPTLVIGRKGTAGSVRFFEHGCYPADTTFYLDWKTEVNVLYLYFYLLANPPSGEHAKTTLPSLPRPDLENLVVPFPPLPEQRAIAHVLSKIQAAVQAQAAIAGRARELKRALMAKLFTEGLRGEPLKETEIGVMPEGWDATLLEKCLRQAQYGLSVRGEKSGRYPLLRMTNQQNGMIAPTDLQYVNIDEQEMTKFRLNRGELLFNRTNSIDLVGRTALFDLEGDFVFASYLIRLALTEEKIEPRYLNFYFNDETTQARLKGLATRGVSQSNISASRLKTLIIPIPPLDEQREIARILQTVDAKIAAAERKRARLEELFRALLGELMTGRVRVVERQPV